MDSPSILRSGRRSGLGRDLFLWHGTGNAVFGFCSITLKPPPTHSFHFFPFPYPLVLFSFFQCSVLCSLFLSVLVLLLLVFVVLYLFNLTNKVISPRYCPLLSPFLNTFTSSPDACDTTSPLTPHPHSYHIPAIALTLILILTLTSHWFRFPTRGACC